MSSLKRFDQMQPKEVVVESAELLGRLQQEVSELARKAGEIAKLFQEFYEFSSDIGAIAKLQIHQDGAVFLQEQNKDIVFIDSNLKEDSLWSSQYSAFSRFFPGTSSDIFFLLAFRVELNKAIKKIPEAAKQKLETLRKAVLFERC